MKQYGRLTLIFCIFLLTRSYVLLNPPYVAEKNGVPGHGYSDVKQDSERYANMWYYGTTPYREHMYEYPPLAIPFVYVPLLVDQAGIGTYYQNYRTGIFIFEFVFFIFLLKAVNRIWMGKSKRWWLALGFYCLIGAIGKDFWYDGLDLLYIGFFSMALITRYLTGASTFFSKVIFWTLFVASFSIKYMTLPLALPLLWLRRREFKFEVVAGIVGFLIIWALPIALYRSSLSVMVVYHTVRPFNYGSFGKWLISAVNDYTHTETQTDILPHLPMIGPVSAATEKVFGWLFVGGVLGSISLITLKIHKLKKRLSVDDELRFSILATILFFMVVFLTNKVFSNPFHIWYAPLIVLLPLGSLTEQLWLMTGAVWMFVLDTTAWIRVSSGFVRIRDFTRFIPIMGFLSYSIKRLIAYEKN